MRARLPATPSRSRIFSRARRSPPQCASPHNLRALRAQPLLSKFSTFLPPWRARRRVAASNALACRQLPHCRNRRNGSAQKSPVCCRVQQTSPRRNSCFLDCGTPSSWDGRFSRAPGPPGDQADDRLGNGWMRSNTASGRRVPCTDSATTSYEMAPFRMPLDRDTERSPRTRVLAVITRR